MDPLLADNAQVADGANEGQDVLEVPWGFQLWWLILPQESLDTLIVWPGGIYVLQYMLVTVPQCIKAHYRDNVGRTVYIVPRHLIE